MNQTYTLASVSFESIIQIFFRPTFVLMLVATAFIGFSILSIILLHHWRTHGTDAAIMRRASKIYFSGGLILLTTLVVATIKLIG